MNKPTILIEDRPAEAPAGWEIWNAPRPLCGTVTWEGDFRHGIFFAAIDPADPVADRFRENNVRDDAHPLEYVTIEEARVRAFDILRATYARYTDEQLQTMVGKADAKALWQTLNPR